MGVHLLAVLGVGLLCALWVVLQLASGERAHGAQGECGACGRERESSDDSSEGCEGR